LFHTIEGGAIVFTHREDLERAKLMINFGIDGPDSISDLGINAKMNEFQAAMGLCVLDDVDEIIAKRKEAWECYRDELSFNLKMQKWTADNNNYGYFPVLFNSEEQLISVKKELKKLNIYPRRYFYPSLNTVDAISNEISITENHEYHWII
jgi:dTDP-4-amino-4,6-dideoxygalactose transaminase